MKTEIKGTSWTTGNKICSKCKKFKDKETEFYNSKSTKDGKTYWCKECMKKNHREDRLVQKTKIQMIVDWFRGKEK